MQTSRVLGVFAHPDDEVFCAGGTFAKYAARGVDVVVVSLTRGEAGQIRDTTLATRSSLGLVREQELRAACAQLGVNDVRFFDHIDGTLRDLDRAALVAEVGAVLDELQPDVVITFGADGAYGHPDHIAVSEVTSEAFVARSRGALYHSHFPRTRLLLLDRLSEWLTELNERFRGPDDFARAFSLFAQETTTLGFADDHLEVAWFPPGSCIVEQGESARSLYLILSGSVDIVQDGPDGTRVFLRRQGAGEFFGERALASHSARTAHVLTTESATCLVFSPAASSAFAARGDAPGATPILASVDPAGADTGAQGTTVIDVSGFVDKKIAAIAAHRTQYPIEPDMFPPSILQDMLGREHFVRVHPPISPEQELFGL
jgi:LmbE family N-acetylglucosaminyl deacetylase